MCEDNEWDEKKKKKKKSPAFCYYFVRRFRVGLGFLSGVGVDRCCFLGYNFLFSPPI